MIYKFIICDKMDKINRRIQELMDSNNYIQAIPFIKKLIDIETEVYGADNDNTTSSMRVLINIMMDENMDGDAEPLLRKLIDIDMRILGKGDPQTIKSMRALASMLMRQNRTEDPFLKENLMNIIDFKVIKNMVKTKKGRDHVKQWEQNGSSISRV